MGTLIDPSTALVADAYEAECRRVMQKRAALKGTPGTHAVQDDLLVDIDYLIDRVNLLRLGR